MATKEKAAEVSANPALVQFPNDPWGMTSDLRKIGLRAAASVRGNAEKHDLLIATLRIIAQHAAARINSDAEALAKRGAEIAARAAAPNSQRIASRGVPVPAAHTPQVTDYGAEG